jgi:hypothetical protein
MQINLQFKKDFWCCKDFFARRDREMSVTVTVTVRSRDSDDRRDEELISLGRILAKDLCTKLFNRISDIKTEL